MQNPQRIQLRYCEMKGRSVHFQLTIRMACLCLRRKWVVGCRTNGWRVAELEKQSYNEPHREFILHRDEYLEIILEREAIPPNQVGTCGHHLVWKCISCHDSPTYCTKCLIDAHRQNPLHRIQHWSGEYWEDGWLRQAGTIIQLGHFGKRCPELEKMVALAREGTKPDHDAEGNLQDPEEAEDSDWGDEDDEDAILISLSVRLIVDFPPLAAVDRGAGGPDARPP